MKLPFHWRQRVQPKNLEGGVAPVVQPEDMDEENRQMLRMAAQMEVQTIVAMRDRVITEISTSVRWVQASLLIVNSGGAVTMLQSEAISGPERTWFGALFVLGIVLSLFTATSGVAAVRDTPVKLTHFAGYWMGVAVDLTRLEQVELDWQAYSVELDRRARLPRALGYASAASFVVACIVAGLGSS